MSIQSRQRHLLKTRYFNYLRETAVEVDPYVKTYIETQFPVAPDLRNLLLKRYRFDKPKLRSALVRLAYNLTTGKDDWRKIIPACAALEIKDTGYYCYDDVLDVKQDPELVLLGGTFSTISYGMITDLYPEYSGEIVSQLVREVVQLDVDNVQAAFLDIHMKSADEQTYLVKAQGYNFWERAFKVGAILGGGSKTHITLLAEIGRYIGTAYIIANDTWDFGKDLEDFRAGKYTLPIMYALDYLKDPLKSQVRELFGKPELSLAERDFVKNAISESGAITYGKARAKELCDRALSLLRQFPDSEIRSLIEFSTTTTQRNRYFDRAAS